MKIGIEFNIFNSGYCRYGDKKYIKLKEHGFSCIDFNMSNTNTEIYTSPASETVDVEFAGDTEDSCVKIMWWRGSMYPMCAAETNSL